MATNKKPTHTLRCGNIKATMAECQRKGTVLRDDLFPAIQGSVWRLAQRDIFRS